jgi:hypothetical protein
LLLLLASRVRGRGGGGGRRRRRRMEGRVQVGQKSGFFLSTSQQLFSAICLGEVYVAERRRR